METASKRYIDVTEEAKAKLAKALKCTAHFVYLALTYRKDTELARKVRYTAVREYGGKPMGHYPECETIHNVTADGRDLMVQNFDNGATLRIDKQTGETWVTNHRGETLMHKQCITIPQLTEIQVMAENM
ncbi:MAG: hypothetical protein K2G30_03350 [Muribaculaceae bacterium]|nr:hypothetical protein [Muribaculaceae bacterium]